MTPREMALKVGFKTYVSDKACVTCGSKTRHSNNDRCSTCTPAIEGMRRVDAINLTPGSLTFISISACASCGGRERYIRSNGCTRCLKRGKSVTQSVVAPKLPPVSNPVVYTGTATVYEGRPCKKCSHTTRFASNKSCVNCNTSGKATTTPRQVDRSKFTYIGKTCNTCGGNERYSSCRKCVKCNSNAQRNPYYNRDEDFLLVEEAPQKQEVYDKLNALNIPGLHVPPGYSIRFSNRSVDRKYVGLDAMNMPMMTMKLFKQNGINATNSAIMIGMGWLDE